MFVLIEFQCSVLPPLNLFLDFFAMDISQYIPDSASYQALSSYQTDKFFNTHQSVSRKDCGDYATTIAGGAIRPTAIQGGSSYTVMAADGSKVIQFRSPQSPMNIEYLDLARDTYGAEFIPACRYLGLLGQTHVYVLDTVAGDALALALKQLFLPGNSHLLVVAIQDYAEYASLSPSFSLAFWPQLYQLVK